MAERKPGKWVTGDAEDFLNDEGRPMERKTEQKPKWKVCGHDDCAVSTGESYEELTFGRGHLDRHGYWSTPCAPCARAWEKENPGERAWPFAPLPTESEPEREWKVGDEAITRGRFRAKNERVRVELIGKDNIPGDWRVRPVGGGVWYLVRESELSPAPETPPCPYGEDADCAFHSHPAHETPSPEVGTTCKDLLQLAEPEAVWLKRMTRQLAGDGATGLIIRNHLRTIIDILRMVAPSAVKDSLTAQQPEACALCGAAADLISVCDDAEECVRRTVAAAKEQSK